MQHQPHIFIDQPIPLEVEQYLAQHSVCTMVRTRGAITLDEWAGTLATVDGLLVSATKVDEKLLALTPKLRAVSTISVGYNHLDIDAMRARGIVGTHTPYVLDETVADLVMGLMLSTARRIAELDRYVRAGQWHILDNEVLFGTDVHHKHLGIIGMGRIGEAIAKRAKWGFGMEVSYYARSRKSTAEQKLGVVYQALDDLLATADFIVMMVPLTPATVRLIGREQFAKMKPSAIFINASRGNTVDESALVEALAQGKIRAAGLDVFEREPISPTHPLLQMPNVVVVPHIGSATAQTRLAMAMCAAENVIDVLYGRTPSAMIPEFKTTFG